MTHAIKDEVLIENRVYWLGNDGLHVYPEYLGPITARPQTSYEDYMKELKTSCLTRKERAERKKKNKAARAARKTNRRK